MKEANRQAPKIPNIIKCESCGKIFETGNDVISPQLANECIDHQIARFCSGLKKRNDFSYASRLTHWLHYFQTQIASHYGKITHVWTEPNCNAYVEATL